MGLLEDVLEFFRETEPVRYTDIYEKQFITGIGSHDNRCQEVQ